MTATADAPEVVLSRTVGLDLGRQADYTALVVLDEFPAGPGRPSTFVVRHIDRYRGVPYPQVVDRVAALAEQPGLRGCPVVVDCTGVGRPVVDSMREKISGVHAVVITGGEQVVRAGSHESHVPKKDLVGAVQLPLQQGRLLVDPGLREAGTLRAELEDFSYSISETGRLSMEASSGQHDDLVLAVALACWAATNRRPQDVNLWIRFLHDTYGPPRYVTPTPPDQLPAQPGPAGYLPTEQPPGPSDDVARRHAVRTEAFRRQFPRDV